MAPITSLPMELLIEILSQDILTNEDVASASLVCHRFNAAAQSSPGRPYDFKVDTHSHHTWKLIRCLLYNPDLGNRFTSITVNWAARVALNNLSGVRGRPPTWTWNEYETSKIKEIGQKNGQEYGIFKELVDEILAGEDSESLLPFLLFFTPKLERLDLGSVVANSPQRWFVRNGLKYFPCICRGLYPEQLWLEVFLCRLVVSVKSVYQINWPPGLRNLKFFSTSNAKLSATDKPESLGIPFSEMWPFLWLPRIEDIRCEDLTDEVLYSLTPMMRCLKSHTGFSQLRRLDLNNCLMPVEELLDLAQATKFLEHLSLNGVFESFYDILDLESLKQDKEQAEGRVESMKGQGFRDLPINLELTLYEFLECNKEHLSFEGITTKVWYRDHEGTTILHSGFNKMQWNQKEGRIELLDRFRGRPPVVLSQWSTLDPIYE
ncbi:hypothetical protein TWF281_006995 [Arthrobotrys megalospora]